MNPKDIIYGDILSAEYDLFSVGKIKKRNKELVKKVEKHNTLQRYKEYRRDPNNQILSNFFRSLVKTQVSL